MAGGKRPGRHVRTRCDSGSSVLEKVQVLPRRVPVGCGLVGAPASSWDSRTQDLIQPLTAELRKHGAPI
jgi:hypothetical protein